MYGFNAISGSHNIYALVEFDITKVRKTLRKKRIQGESGSLFAFLLKAIAQCLQENPLFNSMIDFRKTTAFETVDISVPIEIQKEGEIYNKQYLIKDVTSKTIKQISDEIESSKNLVDDQKGFIVSKHIQTLMSISPKRIVQFVFRRLLKNHKKVKELSGTAFVTSISMFSTVPGFIIPYIGGPKAASFAIGSITKKPVVKNNSIVISEMINITAVFNHDIIDGAPAARFMNQLRKYIEDDHEELDL